MNTILEARDLCAADQGAEPVRGVSLAFEPGTFNLLTGDEACGKHRLLRLLGLLEVPSSGDVFIEGRATSALTEAAREELRNVRFGYVFAAPFLLTSFTVLENIAMPLFRISHSEPDEARLRTGELLEFAGLTDLAGENVRALSPAEQQRASLARGLANRPAVLIVENLDAELGGADLQSFASLLRRTATHFGTAVIATASLQFSAERNDRVIELGAGEVRADSRLMEELGA